MATTDSTMTSIILGNGGTGPVARLLPGIALTAVSVAIILGAVFALYLASMAAPFEETVIHISAGLSGLGEG